MEKKFDLEYQWQEYLKMCGLKEDTLSVQQRRETKRAFFGAAGQLLILFRDDIGSIEDEEKAVGVMQNLIEQVGKYWTSEDRKQNYK